MMTPCQKCNRPVIQKDSVVTLVALYCATGITYDRRKEKIQFSPKRKAGGKKWKSSRAVKLTFAASPLWRSTSLLRSLGCRWWIATTPLTSSTCGRTTEKPVRVFSRRHFWKCCCVTTRSRSLHWLPSNSFLVCRRPRRPTATKP